jgi:hypothetical protein
MWTFYNEIQTPIYWDFNAAVAAGHVMDTPWSWRFSLPPPSHRGGSGWFIPVAVLIMEVRGGYLLPRGGYALSGGSAVILRASTSPSCCPAFECLSRQVIFSNHMGWMIGSSCYWAYTIYFWAVVQSSSICMHFVYIYYSRCLQL